MENKGKQIGEERKLHMQIALVVAALVLAAVVYKSARQAQAVPQRTPAVQTRSTPEPIGRIPPYYENVESAKPIPRLLSASHFREYPVAAKAYRIAGGIPEALAQQPCYCWCEKVGHHSLLDCHSSQHGAG